MRTTVHDRQQASTRAVMPTIRRKQRKWTFAKIPGLIPGLSQPNLEIPGIKKGPRDCVS